MTYAPKKANIICNIAEDIVVEPAMYLLGAGAQVRISAYLGETSPTATLVVIRNGQKKIFQTGKAYLGEIQSIGWPPGRPFYLHESELIFRCPTW